MSAQMDQENLLAAVITNALHAEEPFLKNHAFQSVEKYKWKQINRLNMQVKKENHHKLKAMLLSIAVILGPVAPWILLNAEDWFELAKGLIVIVVIIGIVWIYAHLEPKEEQLPQDLQPPKG